MFVQIRPTFSIPYQVHIPVEWTPFLTFNQQCSTTMNAKQELLHELNALSPVTIKCAIIEFFKDGSDQTLHLEFKVGDDLDTFLNQLDFNYNAGYGLQELSGIVWLTDGTWLVRGEDYRPEWWIHCKVPEIPPELLS
jgi:hypothetical protein